MYSKKDVNVNANNANAIEDYNSRVYINSELIIEMCHRDTLNSRTSASECHILPCTKTAFWLYTMKCCHWQRLVSHVTNVVLTQLLAEYMKIRIDAWYLYNAPRIMPLVAMVTILLSRSKRQRQYHTGRTSVDGNLLRGKVACRLSTATYRIIPWAARRPQCRSCALYRLILYACRESDSEHECMVLGRPTSPADSLI